MIEALRARRRKLHRLLVIEGRRSAQVRQARRMADELKLPVEEVSRESIAERVGADAKTQGLLLEAGDLPLVRIDELVRDDPQAILLALDEVEDPRNVGAILRVADAAGAQGVLVGSRRAAPLGPTVARASAGASEHLPITQVSNMARTLALLKERDYWVIGADSEGGEDLFALPERLVRSKKVLVLGAEGRGMRHGIEKILDLKVRIPMGGAVSSLNVSTAAAICLFEFKRRSNASDSPNP